MISKESLKKESLYKFNWFENIIISIQINVLLQKTYYKVGCMWAHFSLCQVKLATARRDKEMNGGKDVR